MRIGERALLPAVRTAAKVALIVADGFSCRSQIEHATSRRALHVPEVVPLALPEDANGPRLEYPERRCEQRAATVTPTEALGAVLVVAAALGLAVSLTRPRRRAG